MIQFDRVTTEEVIRRSFKDDPRSINTIINSRDDDTISFTWTIRHDNISAKYAKVILKDYLAETIS